MKIGEVYLHKSKPFWRQYNRPFLAFLLLLIIAATIPLSRFSTVLSATYTWTQSAWSGGETLNIAEHPGNQTDWTEFASKDAQIDTMSSTTSITLLANTSSSTETSSADFMNGAFSGATTTGDGTVKLEFLQQGNTWARMADPNTTHTQGYSYSGAALIYTGSGDYLYFSKGNPGSTDMFARYSISNDQWSMLADPPVGCTVGCFGRDIVYPGSGDYIYAQKGEPEIDGGGEYVKETGFWAYSILNNSWNSIFDPADLVSNPTASTSIGLGARLDSSGNGYIYSYEGGQNGAKGSDNHRIFKYSISGDSWSEVIQAPWSPINALSSSISTPEYIFYYIADYVANPVFKAFSITNEDWTTFDPADPTVSYKGQGSIAYPPGSDTIYLAEGLGSGSTCNVQEYSISGDSWDTSTPDIPEACDSGSTMTAAGNFIFLRNIAWPAHPTIINHLWRYALSDTFASSGTYTSATKDAGQGVDYTDLNFSGTVLSDTDGTYLVNSVNLSSAAEHSCVVSGGGRVYCWGYNSDGRLGNGNQDDAYSPVSVLAGEATGSDSDGVNLTNQIQVSSGYNQTCSVSSEGNAYCWGSQGYGRLGNGNDIAASITSPAQVLKGEAVPADTSGTHLSNVKKVTAGSTFSCAVTNSGYVYCWGRALQGKLGNGQDTTNSSVPVRVLAGEATGADSDGTYLQNIVDIEANNSHACAVSNSGNLYCWGAGASGQLGNNIFSANASSPVQVLKGEAAGTDTDGTYLTNIREVSPSYRHTCAVAQSGNLYCWGDSAEGKIGDGQSVSDYATPRRVLTGEATGSDSDGTYLINMSHVDSYRERSCASSYDGYAYCWGDGYNGKLGNGLDSDSNTPVRVVDGEVLGADSDGEYLYNVSSISTGNNHSCASTESGGIYCWGTEGRGQIGDGSGGAGVSLVPTRVHDGEATNINTLRFQIRSADTEGNLSSATWYGPTGVGDYYTSSGQAINAVHDGDRWYQYRVLLDTTDTSLTPSVDSVSVNYQYFTASSSLTSSIYNTNDSANTLAGIAWSETLPTNTDITFQIRTASTSAGLATAEWYGPTGTTSVFTDETGGEALPAAISDSIEDQYIQYKVTLFSTDGLSTPALSDVTLTYVVNSTPFVENVLNDGGGALDQDSDGIIRLQYDTLDIDNTAVESYFFYDIGVTLADEGGVLDVLDTTDIVVNNSQNLPATGTIMIGREVIDYTTNDIASSTLSGISRGMWPGNPAWDSTVAQHINGDTVYLLAQTVSGEGSLTVSSATSTETGITLSPAIDVPGVYLTDATIAVAINDGELANMVGIATSSPFTLDTTTPTGGYLLYNSITNQLTISVSDDSPTQMRLSNDSDLSSDGVNADSGQWIAYGTDGNIDGYGDTPLLGSVNKSWTGTGNDVETIYVQFKDNKGNTSSIVSVDTPRKPSSFIYRDVSNVDIDDYKIFVAWGVIPLPAPGFEHYKVFRSENGGAFTLFNTITDINENYFIDSGLSTTTEYSYKIYSEDTDGNLSDYSVTVTDTPNGQGGSDLTPPTITSVTATNLVPQGVEISWTTDELADSTVGYSVDTGYVTEAGSPTMTTEHSVILSDLTPNTTYNFRVKSEDPTGNVSNWSSGYQFTTPPGPAISNVTVPEVTSATARIAWITDTSSDSYVVYSTNATMASSTQVGSANLVTNHSVHLTGLIEGETYYYYVKSTDGTANESSDTNAGEYYSFVTQIDNDGPVISNVTVATVNNDSATIIWQTDENSTSQIFYGTDTSYGASTTVDTTLSIRHSMMLTGLDKETTYYFKVASVDAGTNASEDDNAGSGFTFTTTDEPGITQTVTIDDTVPADVSAPVLNTVSVSDISSTSAKISWTSTESGNSLVAYGTSQNYQFLMGNYIHLSTFTTNHFVMLENLSPATRYHFKTISQDSAGNLGTSGDNTFTTLNEDGSAVEGAEPPSTETEIGVGIGVEELPGIESSLSMEEEDILDAISKASEAFITEIIKVLPKNPNLNKIPEQDFIDTVAEIAPKVVSSPEIASQDLTVEVGPTWAVFTWVTSKKANGLVGLSPDEGFDGEYKRKEGDPEALKTSHRVVIEGLEPQTIYHYSVQSKGQLGDWAKSPDATFVTTSLLSEIEALKFDSIGTTEVILSWNTSLPTRTSIEVTDTATGEAFTYEDPSLLKEHTVALGDLNLSTNYVLQIVAEDEDGNISSSSVLPFTTQASLVPAVIDQVRTTTALVPGQIERVQTIISWKTDKPATSRVLFEEGVSASTELAQSTPLQPNLVKDHIVVTTQFKPGKVYRFRIESIDGIGNISTSKDYTILTPRPQENVLDLIINNFEESFGFLKNINF
jgi:alpha-tubulin suppressor-like RCC1 family protein